MTGIGFDQLRKLGSGNKSDPNSSTFQIRKIRPVK